MDRAAVLLAEAGFLEKKKTYFVEFHHPAETTCAALPVTALWRPPNGSCNLMRPR